MTIHYNSISVTFSGKEGSITLKHRKTGKMLERKQIAGYNPKSGKIETPVTWETRYTQAANTVCFWASGEHVWTRGSARAGGGPSEAFALAITDAGLELTNEHGERLYLGGTGDRSMENTALAIAAYLNPHLIGLTVVG